MYQSNRSKIYKGMSAQTVVTITLGVLGIVYFAIMSRLLSKEDFGYYAIITAVTSILASLSEAGLGASVIQNKDANKTYVQTAWTLSLVLGVFFSLFLYGSSGFVSRLMTGSNVLKKAYQIMSFALIFYAINGVGRAVIIKRLHFLRYGLFDIAAYTLSAGIGVFMAFHNMGFYSVIVAMLMHQVFLGVLVLIDNRRILAIKIKNSYVKRILTFGGWLTGSVIVRNITDQLDKLITRRWIPVADLGAYNRPAGFISQITGNVYGIFDTILFPILSGINDDANKLKEAYQKSVNLIILFSLILAFVFILGSDIIIEIFLGKKWLYLSNIFQIISVTIIFLSYNRLADCFFRSLGIVKQYFFVRCIILVTTCIAVYVGCQYGILGLAIALVFTRLMSIVFKIFFLASYIAFDRKAFYIRSLYSWTVPFVTFMMCYIVKAFVPFGSLVSVSLFVITMAVLAVIKPLLFGQVFYENVYVVLMSKINNKKPLL